MFLSNIAGAPARRPQGTHSSVRSSHPRLCSMIEPSDTGPAPPQSSALRSDREAVPSQLDLFAGRGRVIPRLVPDAMVPPAAAPVETLSDDDLLESVPKAGPSNIEAVCSEIVSRCLAAAVPALEALWRCFAGFGVEKPLREQLAVLQMTGSTPMLSSALRIWSLRSLIESPPRPRHRCPDTSPMHSSELGPARTNWNAGRPVRPHPRRWERARIPPLRLHVRSTPSLTGADSAGRDNDGTCSTLTSSSPVIGASNVAGTAASNALSTVPARPRL